MKTSTGKPTKAEKQRIDRMLQLGCIACRLDGRFNLAEVHHMNLDGKAGQKRLGHDKTIPLCPWHHRCIRPAGALSLFDACRVLGPSRATSPRRFRQRYGTDDELLAKVDEMLDKGSAI